MKKDEHALIKKNREEMDENPVSEAIFKIQSILEELFQKGIATGEAIGYVKAAMEVDVAHISKNIDSAKKSKTIKGSKQ